MENEHVLAAKAAEARGDFAEAATRWNAAALAPCTPQEYQEQSLAYDRCKREAGVTEEELTERLVLCATAPEAADG
jgi:hypothetical protein